jgi:sulfopyruvate decarboxylase TPP-binding subunit
VLILIRVKTNFLLTQVKAVEEEKSFGVKSPLELMHTKEKMLREEKKRGQKIQLLESLFFF